MDYRELSDEELVARCRRGEQGAWSVLVRRFQRLIYTIPRRARLPEQLAAEVFQVAFSRLFEHIDRLDEPSRVRAWLVTTARRETLKLLRAARGPEMQAWTDDAALPEDESVQSETTDHVTREEQWHEVRHAVDLLEARCRQLIELLFLSEPELSYVEIGIRLGMPTGSIGPTRSRCLDRLRALLQQ